MLKKIIRKIINLTGYRILPQSDFVIDKEFGAIYEKCKKQTMTSKERMYALYKAVKYIIESKIPGDFVECGVWKGGSAMIIAYTLLELNETDRKIYLYDTFKGMPKPTKEEIRVSKKANDAISIWQKAKTKNYNMWCFSPLSEAKNNVFSTGYPINKFVFIQGKVEKTIPEKMPSKVALLRLDTDFYESTIHELNYLFPIVTHNGVLIIDDYGHWSGSKKAVDEYFLGKPILLNRIDYTGRIGIKVE